VKNQSSQKFTGDVGQDDTGKTTAAAAAAAAAAEDRDNADDDEDLSCDEHDSVGKCALLHFTLTTYLAVSQWPS